ncbi:MAG: hypothetical protein ACHQ53_13190, partial [Polyangiales bacterium]
MRLVVGTLLLASLVACKLHSAPLAGKVAGSATKKSAAASHLRADAGTDAARPPGGDVAALDGAAGPSDASIAPRGDGGIEDAGLLGPNSAPHDPPPPPTTG